MSARDDLMEVIVESYPDWLSTDMAQSCASTLLDRYRAEITDIYQGEIRAQALYEAADTVRYADSKGDQPSTVAAILCTMAEDGLQ